jgi:hypothetical protein
MPTTCDPWPGKTKATDIVVLLLFNVAASGILAKPLSSPRLASDNDLSAILSDKSSLPASDHGRYPRKNLRRLHDVLQGAGN